MHIKHYEPRARSLGLLSRLLDDDLTNLLNQEPDAVADWLPAVDIREESGRYVLKADLPGVDPDDIEVTMEQGVLTIQGQRNKETHEETAGYARHERVRGSFMRRFTLPETANGEDISATTTNGVLELVIPKHPQLQPRKIEVRRG